jgi:hypothetical protein
VTVPVAPAGTPYALPPAPQPARPRRRRLAIALIVAWSLLLIVGGVWYSRTGAPTERDQTTIAQARPVVDRAVEAVLQAAGSDPVPAASGFEKSGDCRVTPVRHGAKYQRSLWLYTGKGSERALLDRIAAGLPAGYKARTAGQTVPTLFADAGLYVAVNGTVPEPGGVRVVVSTGCRVPGDTPFAPDPTGVPQPADRSLIDQLAKTTGGTATDWHTHQLPCGARTVEASIAGARPAALTSLLPAGLPTVLSRDDLVALHWDGAGLVLRGDSDELMVAQTTGGCQ